MFRRKRKARDFAEEIKAHLEFETERLREEGLDEREARAAARRAFGNVTEAEERFYESGRWLFWDELRQDLRFAFRMLRKSPGFAAVAVLTLAVAIGANALVFSALDAFLLRPLKVPQPESLYGLQFGEGRRGAQSYPNYEDFRDRNRSFDGLAAYAMARVGLDTGENPARAWLYEVSGNYFDVLNLHPHLGRFFHSSDEHGAGSAPYIVLSYAYWHGHFQDDPGVVGRRVEVNKRPFTIIGVAPQHFTGTFLLLSPARQACRVESLSAISDQCAIASGRKRLCRCGRAGLAEWDPFWGGAGQAGAAQRSVRDREVRFAREVGPPHHLSRGVSRGASCHLRPVGHLFDGGGARAAAVA